MECNRFIEEKVGETESPEFREHLRECAGCRRDVDELEEVRAVYRRASAEKYPRGVSGRRRGWSARWPMAAAAAVLVAVLVFILVAPPAKPPSVPDAGIGFVRMHFEPWDAEEAGLNRKMNELRERLERSRR